MEKTFDPCRSRWLRLLLGALLLLFIGVGYAWSILKVPLAEEFGWEVSPLALNYSLFFLMFGIGGILSGRITGKVSSRLILIIASILILIGLFFSSQLSGESILMLYLFYGGILGFGIGFAYVNIISVTNLWFPDRRGLSSGVLMMSFGLSSLLIGLAASKMIAAPALGWRMTYKIIGVSVFVVLIIGSFFLQAPPEGTEFPPLKKRMSQKAETFQVKELTTKGMLQRFSFWKFYIACVLIIALGSTVISMARDLCLTFGTSVALATSLVGVLSLFNGFGRILCGFLCDLFNRRTATMTMGVLAIIASAAGLLSLWLELMPLGILCVVLTGIAYGCSPTLLPVFAGDMYGQKHLSANYSVLNTVSIPGSFGATFASLILTASGSYQILFLVLLTVSIVAFILLVFSKKP